MQGVKIRIGRFKKKNQVIKKNQFFTFDLKNKLGDKNRVTLPYPKLLKKIKKNHIILVDDGKYAFKVIKSNSLSVITKNLSQDFTISDMKSVHIKNLSMPFNNFTIKDKLDIKLGKKLGCDWIALSYVEDAKLIYKAKKLLGKNIGIISKIENKLAVKNIDEIIKASDAIMVARGDLALDVGHSEVPKIQLGIIKKCNNNSKPVIVALPKGKPAVIITKSFFLIDLSFLIICRDIFIISFQPLASLLFIDRTPHNKDICLLTIIFGDIVIILTLGLTADTNFAVVPELEKAIIAFTDGL